MYADQFFCIYANDSGTPIGALVYHQEVPKDDSYNEDFDEENVILWFSRVVSPDCGNQGIAKEMLDSFIESNRSFIIKSETWNRKLDQSLINRGFLLEDTIDRINGDVIKVHALYPRGHFKKATMSGLFTLIPNKEICKLINDKVG